MNFFGKLYKIFFVLLITGCYSGYVSATQEELDSEIEYYYKILQVDNYYTDLDDIKDVSRELTWSGITDQKIYDEINSRIIDFYVGDPRVTLDDDVDKVSYLLKMLGLSGNEKYRVTLEINAEISKTSDSIIGSENKIMRYAETGLARLNKFKIYAPIIQKDFDKAPAGGLKKKRLLNMISSDHLELVRAGAKLGYKHFRHDKDILDGVAVSLRNNISKLDSKYYTDTMRWLIKYLARGGGLTYVNDIEYVRKHTGDKKVADEADMHIDQIRMRKKN